MLMKHFYKHSMHRLMAPLMAQTASEQVSKGIYMRFTNNESVATTCAGSVCTFVCRQLAYTVHVYTIVVPCIMLIAHFGFPRHVTECSVAVTHIGHTFLVCGETHLSH